MSAFEQRLDVDAHEGGGHETEEGQGRETGADRGGIEERAPETRFGGDLVEGAARIGDGHEVDARPGHGGRLDLRPEILVEGEGLRRVARLARHDEERTRQGQPVERLLHRRGIRGIQDDDVGEAHLGSEGEVEHVGGEAGATHAEEDHVGELQAADLVGEALDVFDVASHDRG